MPNAKTKAPTIPLPPSWPETVKSAVLHVISLAQFATSHTCDPQAAANSRNSRIRSYDPPLSDEFRALFELPKNASTENEAEFLALLNTIGEA